MDLDQYHPYRIRIFWIVLGVTFGLIIIFSANLFFSLSRAIVNQTQEDLQAIAVETAQRIPVDVHEQLQKPADQETDGYKRIENIMQSIMAGNPKIDDIYTLRPTSDAHIFTFVVTGKDTADYNHNNYIDDNEIKAALGERYDASGMTYLEKGLTAPSYDHKITYDKWGAWLSGYAPLKDSTGKTVAVLGVDFSADSINSEINRMLTIMVQVDAIMFILCLVTALLTAHRIQRPFHMLTRAMSRVLHGEPEFKMPADRKSEEGLMGEFFNHMKNVLWEEAKRQAEKDKRE